MDNASQFDVTPPEAKRCAEAMLSLYHVYYSLRGCLSESMRTRLGLPPTLEFFLVQDDGSDNAASLIGSLEELSAKVGRGVVGVTPVIVPAGRRQTLVFPLSPEDAARLYYSLCGDGTPLPLFPAMPGEFRASLVDCAAGDCYQFAMSVPVQHDPTWN